MIYFVAIEWEDVDADSPQQAADWVVERIRNMPDHQSVLCRVTPDDGESETVGVFVPPETES